MATEEVKQDQKQRFFKNMDKTKGKYKNKEPKTLEYEYFYNPKE